MKRTFLAGAVGLVAILSFAATLASAVSPPDFSGKWTLNAKKSEFGDFAPLTRLTDEIVQTATELKIHRTQATEDHEVSSDITYKFGEDKIVQLPAGENHTSARWEGSVLIVDLQIETSIRLHVVDRWSLSADGRELRIDRQYGNENGSVKQMLVLEKQ